MTKQSEPANQCVYVGLCIKSISLPTKRKRAEITIAFDPSDNKRVVPMLEQLMRQVMGSLFAPVNIRGLRLEWQDYSNVGEKKK